jgi:hypothetical protein
LLWRPEARQTHEVRRRRCPIVTLARLAEGALPRKAPISAVSSSERIARRRPLLVHPGNHRSHRACVSWRLRPEVARRRPWAIRRPRTLRGMLHSLDMVRPPLASWPGPPRRPRLRR